MRVKSLVLALGLGLCSLVGCRTVPTEVKAAHELSIVETDAAFSKMQGLFTQIENRVDTLNDEAIQAIRQEWENHIVKVFDARTVVRGYLTDTQADTDVTFGYATGTRLLADLDINAHTVFVVWDRMLAGEVGTDEFLAAFRRDIQRFKTLERKFDEWIKQYRVKD